MSIMKNVKIYEDFHSDVAIEFLEKDQYDEIIGKLEPIVAYVEELKGELSEHYYVRLKEVNDILTGVIIDLDDERKFI